MFETDSERHPRPMEVSPMELSLETPIFHALTAGRSNGPSTGVSIGSSADMSLYGRTEPDAIAAEPDALTEFHRDPLLAPIPIQAYAQPTLPPANEYGRHHRPVPALPCAYRW